MNKAYRLIWNKAKDAWVIVAEIVKGNGGPAPLMRVLIAAVSVLALSTTALALPTGAQVVNGAVTMNTQGNILTVTNTPNSIINWQGFSIAAGETTRFVQQSSSSAVLNRVVGVDPSSIMGTLQSNGRIFLLNPNGIIFGQGSRVDAAGLIASSLNMTDADFMGGRYVFNAGPTAGTVKNQGSISTTSGGHVWLIAPNAENSGIITAPNGTVTLAAGQSVHVVDPNKPEVAVVVSAPADQAVNLGSIVAPGGRIGMYGAIVGHKGTINANSATRGENGSIYFKSTQSTTIAAGSATTADGPDGGSITVQTESGDTLVSGDISATGSDGKGGTIQILGTRVGLLDNATVDVSGATGGGTALVGGDYQGKNPDIRNAKATYVGKDTVITADALFKGDGGKVIVWADNTTRAFGSISAKGGFGGGNGGFVETSGKNFLDVNGIRVNTSAAEGNAGNWLLDPNDIVIGGLATTAMQTGTAPAPVTFDYGIGTSQLLATDLAAQLGAGGNVTVSTNAGLSAPLSGTITVLSPVTWGTTNSLTLSANNNIDISANITGANGTLTLAAPGTVSQTTGSINVSGLQLLGAGASTFSLTNSANNVTTLAGINASSITFNSTGAMLNIGTVGGTTGVGSSGNIAIVNGGGGISVGIAAPVSSSTGTVTLNSAGSFTSNASSTIQGTSVTIATTAGGNILLNGGVTGTAGAINLVTSGTANSISGTGTLTGPGLSASAGSGISLTGSNNVAAVSLNNSTSGNISYSSNRAAGLTINAVNQGGNISISEGTGNINLQLTKTGAGGTANILASMGAIIDGDGPAINVFANTLNMTAYTGIGTAADAIETQVANFSATNSMAGDIVITNNTAAAPAPLTITGMSNSLNGIIFESFGPVTTTGAISAGVDITLKANSPLTIGSGGVTSSSGNLVLIAGVTGAGATTDILTLNGPLSATGTAPGGNVTLQAGNGIVENSTITAGGTITRSANLNPPAAGTATPTTATLMASATVVQGINIAVVPTEESDPASKPQTESDEEKAKKEAKAKKDAEDKQNKKGEEGQQYCN